jgi:O-antigen/teichoic acid export membrane protein
MVIFPLASELDKQREKLRQLYTKATKIICFLVVFLAVTLIVESRTFLNLWMGPEFGEKSADLLIFHTVTFGLLAVYIIPFQMAEGLGYPVFNFLLMAAVLLVGVPLMINLSGTGGNVGVAIGRLTAFSLMFLSTFYLERWFFGKVQLRFWITVAGFLALAAIPAAIVETVLIQNLPAGWAAFTTAVAAGGLVYCAVLWLLGFVTEEEKGLIRRIAG